MSGVARFDCYPSDFLNGVIGLTGDEIAAYTIVLMLQYDRGEPVVYEGRERELSVRSGLPRGRLASAIQRLVELGKLTLAQGALSNDRTTKELGKISERIQKNSENSQIGGEATRKKWERFRNENNENESRPASQSDSRNEALLSPPSATVLPPIVSEAKASVVRTKKVRTKIAYSELFERFWSAYPTDANMSKQEAYQEFEKLSPDDKDKAIHSCPAFCSYCSTHKDYRPVHANRYLSQGRFEGHAATAKSSNSMIFVAVGTPQWAAWER